MSGERVAIGRVGRPHGLDGAFVVEDASSDRRWFQPGARLYAAGEEIEVLAARTGAGGRPVVLLGRPFERGTPLEVPRSSLPETADGEYYRFELVGLEVFEPDGRALGRVSAVVPGVANDVLELEGGALLPFVEACVREIDLERGRILVETGFADPL